MTERSGPPPFISPGKAPPTRGASTGKPPSGFYTGFALGKNIKRNETKTKCVIFLMNSRPLFGVTADAQKKNSSLFYCVISVKKKYWFTSTWCRQSDIFFVIHLFYITIHCKFIPRQKSEKFIFAIDVMIENRRYVLFLFFQQKIFVLFLWNISF